MLILRSSLSLFVYLLLGLSGRSLCNYTLRLDTLGVISYSVIVCWLDKRIVVFGSSILFLAIIQHRWQHWYSFMCLLHCCLYCWMCVISSFSYWCILHQNLRVLVGTFFIVLHFHLLMLLLLIWLPTRHAFVCSLHSTTLIRSLSLMCLIDLIIQRQLHSHLVLPTALLLRPLSLAAIVRLLNIWLMLVLVSPGGRSIDNNNRPLQ